MSVREALAALRSHLDAIRLPLDTAGAGPARAALRAMIAQLDDYVLARVARLDAPLLAVVGGSTGAGKSTLVNSLVGRPVTATGVVRPTTRAPVLVHHPADRAWFEEGQVLPDLPRGAEETGLRLVADEGVPAGLALLDAPDIDSVVTQNRALGERLLAAADLWIFVTSAARYADAVPWELLTAAARRRAAVAVVLDRVPAEATAEVRGDLAMMLADHDLGDAPLLVVEESPVDARGLLAPEAVQTVRDWLWTLAADAAARTQTARRTLDGAISALTGQVSDLLAELDRQEAAVARLRTAATEPYAAARQRIAEASSDGSLLRGEILARWQDFVGAGDLARSLQTHVGRIRDRLSAFLRGRAQPAEPVAEAIGHGLSAMLVDEASRAAEQADRSWRVDSAGAALLAGDDLSRPSADFWQRADRLVREWQRAVFELVRTEGAGKRTGARLVSFGVNGVAVALMVVVFASTAGLTGLEVGIAGGSAVVGQKLLEAIFGDEAVRRLTATAREDLLARVDRALGAEQDRLTNRLDALGLDERLGSDLREALALVGDAVRGDAARRAQRGEPDAADR